MEVAFFAIFALLTVVSALSVILQRNPIYSALSLIVVIASIGGLFLLLHSTFLAVLQVIVYAGAIMALFLFVVMMVDLREEPWSLSRQSLGVLLILIGISGAIIWAMSAAVGGFSSVQTHFGLRDLA